VERHPNPSVPVSGGDSGNSRFFFATNEGLQYKNHSIRVTFPLELSTKKSHGRGKTTTSSKVNQSRKYEPRGIRPGNLLHVPFRIVHFPFLEVKITHM